MYKPEFTGPIEGWVVNFLTKHYWRVERSMDRDDAMQEAREVFLRISNHYAGKIETPQHFMSLFKTSWTNHFTDLANADTLRRCEISLTPGPEDDGDVRDLPGVSDNDGALATLLRQAPDEVKMVLNLFLNAPQEILDMALGSWNGRDRRCRTGGSKKICQLLGLPEHLDVMQMTLDHFER